VANRKLPKAGTIEIVPSILSADFARLADEIAQVEQAGINMLHIDVMDGHYVPNITIGPPVVEKLRKYSRLVFDVHLMLSEPEKYYELFVEAGADHITFHAETVSQPEKIIDSLHALGVTAGLSLKPEAPVKTIEKIAPLCDMIMAMTVEPGFGGQELIEQAAKKCVQIRQIVPDQVRVEVDGGINAQNAARLVSYGADTLVIGNSIFSKPDRAAAIEAIRKACSACT
jgi:ribulose-phosphate 3-epimerase